MNFPAQAFAVRSPIDLQPGELFQSRGSWALRVVYEAWQTPTQGYILLEGERAGSLVPLRDGIATGLCIASPFSWFPAASIAGATVSARLTAALTLTESGVVVVGGYTDRLNDTDYRAFDIDGSEVAGFEEWRPAPRLAVWTIELQHEARPFESLGTLASIDRREQSD